MLIKDFLSNLMENLTSAKITFLSQKRKSVPYILSWCVSCCLSLIVQPVGWHQKERFVNITKSHSLYLLQPGTISKQPTSTFVCMMHSLEVNDFVCTECSNSLYPKGFSTPFTTKPLSSYVFWRISVVQVCATFPLSLLMMCVLSSKEKLNFLSHIIQSTILIDNWFIRQLCVHCRIYRYKASGKFRGHSTN